MSNRTGLYRTATRERGGAYEFGTWLSYDAAFLEVIRITESWREMGLQVLPWDEIFPYDLGRKRLVGRLAHKRKWTFTIELVGQHEG